MTKTWRERLADVDSSEQTATQAMITGAMQAQIDDLVAELSELDRQAPAVIYQGGGDFRFTGLVDVFPRGSLLYLAARGPVERGRNGTGRRELEKPSESRPTPRVERRRSTAIRRHDILSCACAVCRDTRASFVGEGGR